ncbi:hypothetical protein QQL45_25440 [Achromobacter insolitus]|uniref:hypothetical protein n=1 Tax=Achromobacter insolitus TaxID=217204 RepID=UPI00265B3865|nr:hypothetical protein [Achromobacter insolitus]WKK17098.1 hypothetical protein QQL45_25440 [Achromobacter insolitus]
MEDNVSSGCSRLIVVGVPRLKAVQADAKQKQTQSKSRRKAKKASREVGFFVVCAVFRAREGFSPAFQSGRFVHGAQTIALNRPFHYPSLDLTQADSHRLSRVACKPDYH